MGTAPLRGLEKPQVLARGHEFLSLEHPALAPNAFSFLRVRTGTPAGAAVGPVPLLRMSADADFIPLHVKISWDCHGQALGALACLR